MVRKNPLLGLRSNEKERQIWGISDKTKTNSTEGLEFGSVALAVVQGNGYGGLEREREREDGGIWRVREIREISGVILSFRE